MIKIIFPILLAIALIAGVFIGVKIPKNQTLNNVFPQKSQASEKISTILDLIDENYVDKVDIDSITEKAMPELLSQLDPHCVYLSNQDLQIANDDLEGSFSGIGVQFSLEDDTIMISNVISGGPCDKKGVRAGDRIVTVDTVNFTGKEITSDKVVKTLRGKKGTKVKLGIYRPGNEGLLDFEITRDDISVSSIDIAYMVTPTTGLIRVNKFGEKTYSEFMQSLIKLHRMGAKRYVIDLRDNPGGYLTAVIRMANEFLEKDQTIVFTKGRAKGTSDSCKADGNGHFKNVPVTVLINEWSASASEIFAGAMQDNDRGTVIGRRSFGKGLVQQQFTIDKTTEVRLTISRYYTPSGRCIQKPYKNGKDYSSEVFDRYEKGEMEDSSKIEHKENEEQFKTLKGRTVYGGGGITPDIFVAAKIDGDNSYYRSLSNKALYDFAFHYTDRNRSILKSFKTQKELEEYLDSQKLENELAEFAKKEKKININSNMLDQCKLILRNRISACIVRNFFGDEGFHSVLNKIDPIVQKAIGNIADDVCTEGYDEGDKF